MQFDENPYLHTEEAAPPEQQTTQQLYLQPSQQQPYQQSYPYQPYQQPYQQQNYQQPYQQNYQQPYQQQPYQQPYQPYPQQRYYGAQPNKASGMAKAFSIVSFATGILSLFSVMSGMFSLFFSLTGMSTLTSPTDIGSLVASTLTFAVPGLVFGIIALIKKTRLLPMAIIGVMLNGSLVAVTLLTLFFETIL